MIKLKKFWISLCRRRHFWESLSDRLCPMFHRTIKVCKTQKINSFSVRKKSKISLVLQSKFKKFLLF